MPYLCLQLKLPIVPTSSIWFVCRSIKTEAKTTNCRLPKLPVWSEPGVSNLAIRENKMREERCSKTREVWREWFSVKRSNNRLPVFRLYFLCSVVFICLWVHDMKTHSFSCVHVYTSMRGVYDISYLSVCVCVLLVIPRQLFCDWSALLFDYFH